MHDEDVAGSEITRMSILSLLGREGPASRAAIARELDLSPATVSQVTRRLVQQGVVEPLYFAPSEGGRPGQLLGLVAHAGRAIGVKLAPNHLVLVNVHLDGQVVDARTEPFDALGPDALPVLLQSLTSFLSADGTRLLGVGICVPGVVARPDVGDVDADVLGWSSVPLGRRLREQTGVPVLVENDVKALAEAERLYGRGRGRRNFVVLTIGRGIGFACVTNGALERGSSGGAGELGHVVVSTNGPQCACGQRGCLESFVGEEGLIVAARATGVLKAGQGLERLTKLANGGDGRAREVFARAGQRLAQAVAPAIAALNPETVLVAGEGTACWSHWDRAFRAGLERRLPAWMRSTPIEVDEWDESSWARGAAALVLATPFDRNALAGQQRPQVLARLHGLPRGERRSRLGWEDRRVALGPA
ncbi:MAG TPA: ROK family transcriptional regulator [Acidimicrobiales bacterium]|nr:ROK family transcriptional regulator [Acidimicrobiales bacterium]